jgi:hypothetical protein
LGYVFATPEKYECSIRSQTQTSYRRFSTTFKHDRHRIADAKKVQMQTLGFWAFAESFSTASLETLGRSFGVSRVFGVSMKRIWVIARSAT